jgi:PAS domain S-box-containing protein
MPVDFLIFATFSVGILLLLWQLLPRLARGARLPAITWVVVALVLVIGWFRVNGAGQQEVERVRRLFETIAPTYAAELAHLGHERITLDTPPDDPTYLACIEAAKRWMKANKLARSIYTMRRLADGRTVLIVDPETDYDGNGQIEGEAEARTKLGEVWPEEDPGLELALAGQANFDEKVITDRWGSWVGVWAPVYGTDGQVEAALGIDYAAEDWIAGIAGARRTRLWQIGFFILTVCAGMTAIALLRADLSHRREAEARFRADEERWEMMLAQMPMAFLELNTRAEVIGWNRAAETTFGYPASEALGRKFFDLIVLPEHRESVGAVWQSLVHQTGGSHHINENVTKDGRRITCEWSNRSVTNVQGEVLAVVSLGRDITDRVSLEEQVRQSQKLTSIGQLAAGVAHDFNNLLTAIQGHADLLRVRHDLADDARSDVERITLAAERAADLTRQLLTFSRKQVIFPRPLDLNAAVADTMQLLGRVIGEDIRIDVQAEKDLPPVEADPTMIHQLVTNLMLNARDAMPAGGALRITTSRVEISENARLLNPERRAGTAVRLTVEDSGAGISPEHLPRIFEPFFTTKEVGKGTGLGLSAVHGIVTQHGGWIEVFSTVGIGTKFAVFLPPTDKLVPTVQDRLHAPPPAAPASLRTVLVVEDDSSVRMLACLALRRGGFEVLEAIDGPSATKIWAEHRDSIDALLTDMVMPNGVGGRELAARFLAEKPDLAVVYQSGYSVTIAAPGFCESEREIFLQKPYVPEDLLKALARVMDRKPVQSRATLESATPALSRA